MLLLIALAVADIPPPEDYVENCTMEKQLKPGFECVLCASSYNNPNKCMKQLQEFGFLQACTTYGASVWDEIWCRPEGGRVVPAERLAQLKVGWDDEWSSDPRYVPPVFTPVSPPPRVIPLPVAQDVPVSVTPRGCAAGSVGFLALVGLFQLWMRRHRLAMG